MRVQTYPKADAGELIRTVETGGYWNRGIDPADLLEKYQNEILIPHLNEDDPGWEVVAFHYSAAFLFEAGFIHGVRSERMRRKKGGKGNVEFVRA